MGDFRLLPGNARLNQGGNGFLVVRLAKESVHMGGYNRADIVDRFQRFQLSGLNGVKGAKVVGEIGRRCLAYFTNT